MDDNLLELVSARIGEVTIDEISAALTPAVNKLQRIIEREGDGNGERFKPYYLAAIISEIITAQRISTGGLKR